MDSNVTVTDGRFFRTWVTLIKKPTGNLDYRYLGQRYLDQGTVKEFTKDGWQPIHNLKKNDSVFIKDLGIIKTI